MLEVSSYQSLRFIWKVESRMTNEKKPYGCFSDLPFIGPVEASALYSSLQSSRVHKLQEKMMAFCRELLFFMDSEATLGKLVRGYNAEKLCVFPEFNKVTKTGLDFEANYVTIFHGQRNHHENYPSDGYRAVLLGSQGIDMVWTEIIRFIFGETDRQPKFKIINCDEAVMSGSGAYLFSILIAGFKSIVLTLSSTAVFLERLKEVSLHFHILNTATGRAIGDKIHFFLENTLKVNVRHEEGESLLDGYERLVNNASVIEAESISEWREEICSAAVEYFEEICEADRGKSELFNSNIMLIILPDLAEICSIQARIMDSYTSVPIKVVRCTDLSNDASVLDKGDPLILICSSSWICEQGSSSFVNRVLHRMNILRALHCGYIEYGENIKEEILNSVSFLPTEVTEDGHLTIVQYRRRFFNSLKPESRDGTELSAAHIDLPGALLLAFRRFLGRYSPDSHLPRLFLPESMFFNASGYKQFMRVVNFLERTGAAQFDAPTNEIELTALGRFLSYNYRISDDYSYSKDFSLIDAKIILWSFILRQSKGKTLELIQGGRENAKVTLSMFEEFCSKHRLHLESNDEFDNPELVTYLASYGLQKGAELSDEKFHRLHYLLSLTSGKREKVTPLTCGEVLPTQCRGWYPSGVSSYPTPVQTFCYPSSNYFCNITDSSCEAPVQCPLEISYPILILRSILHISLHNNCIFLESDDVSKLSPISLEILRIPTVQMIISRGNFPSGSNWLDGVLNAGELLPCSTSYLNQLRYSGDRLTYFPSNHPSRKREREIHAPEETSANTSFEGKKPRSEIEKTAIDEFVSVVKCLGREKAENLVRGKKGFGFIEPTHDLHSYYLYILSSAA